MPPADLALFPLDTVLFPGGPLPLRIFEARYLDMVRRCLKEHSAFGVVLILAGAEAGAVSEVADTGTSARLVDFDALPDGLLGITCVGERRFRVRRRWQQSDGLNLAEVDYLPEDAPSALPEALAHLGDPWRPRGSACAGRVPCRPPPRRNSSCCSSMIPWHASRRWRHGQSGNPRLR